MSEVSERYGVIADGFAHRLQGVGPTQWDAETPCSDWNTRELVVHVIRTHRQVRSSLDGSEAQEVEGDGDLGGQWNAARDAIGSALADDEAANTTVGGMFGEQPFESLVGRLLCADTLIHTWDLARATNQDEHLDGDAVQKSYEFLLPIDDAIRRPGGFAAKIEPPDDADEQTKLLNFAGRAL